MTDASESAKSWAAFARHVIQLVIQGNDAQLVEPPMDAARPFGGAFVTLRKSGRLRGCMGSLDVNTPVAQAVRQAAISAALHDPRFPPVGLAELGEIVIEVSILSPPWAMRNLDELELGKHGILIRQGARRGLFLPQVATEHHLDRESFVSRCCNEKAGLAPDAWRDPATEVLLFTTEVYGETD